MAGRFEPQPGGGSTIWLSELEISVLRDYTEQLLELIGHGEEASNDDPLHAALNFGPSQSPTDPALARLFPDAYKPENNDDDEARDASAEFRRYTENDLRDRKRDDARALIRSLDTLAPTHDSTAALHLKPDECQRWLGTLNDLRLALGTRLDLTEEHLDDRILLQYDNDPRRPMLLAYFWLSALQESLIESLMP